MYYLLFVELSKKYIHTMVKAKRFILRKHFEGIPKPGDVELIEEELPELNENGI